MYMFSRDRINMDIEQSTLELMLSLLSSDTQQMLEDSDKATKKEYDRLCHKICDIAKQMKKDGGVKNNKQLELDLNDVSVSIWKIILIVNNSCNSSSRCSVCVVSTSNINSSSSISSSIPWLCYNVSMIQLS